MSGVDLGLSAEGRLYNFAHKFLWVCLSLIGYELFPNLDPITDEEIEWFRLGDSLANYLVKESYAPQHHEQITKQQGRLLYDVWEAAADEAFAKWLKYMKDAADTIHDGYPNITRDEWLYYLSQWALQYFLQEFDQVLHESRKHSDVYFKRYAEHIGQFEAMRQALADERISLATRDDLDELQLAELERRLTDQARHLRQDWRETVITIAYEF